MTIDLDRTERRRERGNLVAHVGAALRKSILDGNYEAGAKLPSEAELTRAHQVSRTVVREAIAALRADGLVEARQGAGVFVRTPPPAPVMPFQNIEPERISSILEVLELRVPVEVEAAGLAALRRSPAQEEAILSRHAAVGALIQAGRPTVEADFALHMAIATATNNPRFGEMLGLMGAAMIPRALLGEAGERNSASYLKQLHEEHAAIVFAILDGDVERAREAMRLHLQESLGRYRAMLKAR